MKNKIFISYRRSDTADEAYRLYQKLTEDFGKDRVFLDISNINLGRNFEHTIEQAIKLTSIFIVLIGPNWEGKTNRTELRINSEDDYVRYEVQSALHKEDIKIIPVLINREEIPDKLNLPTEISRLTTLPFIKEGIYTYNDLFKEITKYFKNEKSSINLRKEEANQISRGVIAYAWIPAIIASLYYNIFGGIGVGTFFIVPALSGLLALKYGIHGFYATLLATAPFTIGLKGNFGGVGGIASYNIAGWIMAYLLSSKENFNIIKQMTEDKHKLAMLLSIVPASFLIMKNDANLDYGMEATLSISFNQTLYFICLLIGIAEISIKRSAYIIIAMLSISYGAEQLILKIHPNLTTKDIDYVFLGYNIQFAYKFSFGNAISILFFYLLGVSYILYKKRSIKANPIIIVAISLISYSFCSLSPAIENYPFIEDIYKQIPYFSFLILSGLLFGFYIRNYSYWFLLFAYLSFLLLSINGFYEIITLPIIWLGYYFLGKKLHTSLIDENVPMK